MGRIRKRYFRRTVLNRLTEILDILDPDLDEGSEETPFDELAGICVTIPARVLEWKTWKELAKEAIRIQNSVNMGGVSASFADVVKNVQHLLEKVGKNNTDNVRTHPIVKLWTCKMADLSGLSVSGFADAFEEVEQLASMDSEA